MVYDNIANQISCRCVFTEQFIPIGNFQKSSEHGAVTNSRVERYVVLFCALPVWM